MLPPGKARVCATGTRPLHRHLGRHGPEVTRGRRRSSPPKGTSVEVIDLRTIMPWDREAVADTIARTAKLLVVHEDTLTAGFGGEVAAWAGEHCYDDLDGPIRRVGATDTFVAYEPTLENAILPQVEDIEAAARELAAY